MNDIPAPQAMNLTLHTSQTHTPGTLLAHTCFGLHDTPGSLLTPFMHGQLLCMHHTHHTNLMYNDGAKKLSQTLPICMPHVHRVYTTDQKDENCYCGVSFTEHKVVRARTQPRAYEIARI